MEKQGQKSRPASTVILVRESEAEKGLQVYLLKRSVKSGFFPGSYVFPGGALDSDDWDTIFWQNHLDLTVQDLEGLFGDGLAVESLMAYGVAAIRETLEEAGVLLAQKRIGDWASSEPLCERPSPEALSSGWFRKNILSEGLRLSFSRLLPWSHWITPEAMPKRFDTRFFIAAMPEGQICKPDERETTHGLWISPQKGLEGNEMGAIPLSPPTLVTLHSLLPFNNMKDLTRAAASRSWGQPIMPIVFLTDKERVLIEPWDPCYGKDPEMGSVHMKEMVLPVGEPFSRLWFEDGIWRPIKMS
jgi:8-oxo-dGTP pyrophosphatase MutT (NUDIX family)